MTVANLTNHKAVRLIAPPHAFELVKERPRCVADRSTRYAGAFEAQHPSKQCAHSASYKIDDKPLCTRHASIYALQLLLGESK